MFINLYYKELSAKFLSMDLNINSKCNSSMDKLNDMMLALYTADIKFGSYKEFEAYAHKKFKNSIKVNDSKSKRYKENCHK